MKRAMTTDDFLQLSVLSDANLQPDGNGFAYVETTIEEDEKYVANIVYQDMQSGERVQWTYGSETNNMPRFSPDGKFVAFQSNRSGTQQIWLLPLDGGEAKQLTTFENGASHPKWAPDGTAIYFTASVTAEMDIQKQVEKTVEEKKQEREDKSKQPIIVDRLQYKSDASGFINHDKTTHIFCYELVDDTITQLTDGDRHHYLTDISPDGESILYIRKSTENVDLEFTSDLYIKQIETKKEECLTSKTLSIYGATYSPNGKKLVITGHDGSHKGATLAGLYVMDVSSKKLTELSGDWDIPVGDFLIGDTRLGSSNTGPFWAENGEKLYFIGTDRGATNVYETDVHGTLQTIYCNNNHVFDLDYREGQFIAGISTPTDPGNFYSLQLDGTGNKITKTNETFKEEVHIEEPMEEIFTMEDGWEVQGWLLKPYGYEAGKKYPFILEIHGGPHMMYGQGFFHEMQLLAAKGYVVLYTNPRGSHGYGQQFVDAVRHHYGEGDYTDLMTVVDQVIDKYDFIDEKRLGVTGGSYGGFMTNWIVGHTNRFKAAVTQRSISNWLSFYGVSDIGYFFNEWEHGLNLLDDPRKLWDISPLKYAANVETPLLILHGELDFRCPIEQGEQLYVTLKHLGKDVRFVRFPGANHELSRSGHPQMRIHRLEQIINWFETYV